MAIPSQKKEKIMTSKQTAASYAIERVHGIRSPASGTPPKSESSVPQGSVEPMPPSSKQVAQPTMEASPNCAANALHKRNNHPLNLQDKTRNTSKPRSTPPTALPNRPSRSSSMGSIGALLRNNFWRFTLALSDEDRAKAAREAEANEAPNANVRDAGADGRKQNQINNEKENEKFRPGWRFHWIFFCLCLLTLIVALDATSLSVALPIISTALKLPTLDAFWAGTSFLLTSTLSQPILAALSHVFGRVRITLWSLAIFTLGCILAALSRDFAYLVAGRIFQGIGAGGLISLTEIIITDIVPLRDRGTYYGYIAGTWAVGSVSGPLLGGALSSTKGHSGTFAEGWRWIFWFNVPIAVIAGAAIPFLLRLEQPMKDKSLKEKLKAVDWIGAFLLTVSTTIILVPLTWAGIQYPWGSAAVLVPLFLGILGIACFLFWEIKDYHKGEPLIQLSIFNNPTAIASYFGILIQGIILWALLYYLPFYYEACHGYTPLISGVAVLPETLSVAPTALFTGILITRYGKYTPPVFIGWGITTLGLGLMYLLDEHTSKPKWIALNILPGLGLGLLFPGLEYATQAAAGQKHVAHAAAMYNFIRAFGQSIGVAIGGLIFQTQFLKSLLMHPELFDRKAAALYAKDATALIDMLTELKSIAPPEGGNGLIVVTEGMGELKAVLLSSYAGALKVLWVVMAGLAAVAGAVSWWTRELGIDEGLGGGQGLRRKEREERGEEGGQIMKMSGAL
ncbi:MFS general substrate transporter [Amniculicola lignicola CBS 123094]|uniref:MFS general substrate transporter n=1 Tax=Amniculicola lignicola CBS 123094 TaxID=1392246 RepID=A0A6A5WZR0_9PLEO|nr:MFS general substrate transporter [Amniculicola lignicola CBS 123094]